MKSQPFKDCPICGGDGTFDAGDDTTGASQYIDCPACDIRELLSRFYFIVMAHLYWRAIGEKYAEMGQCPPEKVMDYAYEQSSDLWHVLKDVSEMSGLNSKSVGLMR